MNLLRKPDRSNEMRNRAGVGSNESAHSGERGHFGVFFQMAQPGNPLGDLQQFVGTWTSIARGHTVSNP